MDLKRSLEKRILKLRGKLFGGKILDEQSLGNMSRRNPNLSLAEDRLNEVAEYFNITLEAAREAESEVEKQRCRELFADVSTDERVLQNYRDSQQFKIARMMNAFTRFPNAGKLLNYLNAQFPPARRKTVRVMDYGCGVSDYGLAFALLDYSVTIADIAGGNLDFSAWRFRERGLPLNTVEVTAENLYPELPQQNVILCAEVFEHLRNPLRVLENMHAALPPGGLLWYSGYPDHPREVGGEHLAEAGALREEALAFVHARFKPGTRLQLPGFLYRKL